ncbi:DNA modification system-associated small protein [Sutcliffiella horikoshii]|uniref:DNA modification system-associated small protein n=1 Tax=Sutcliffiella horikoshii TaxID=79883 RepID=UPI003CE906AB
MKEVQRRELELLAKICNKNGVPLKLARDLIKTAEKHSYENISASTRVTEYQELIKFQMKNK